MDDNNRGKPILGTPHYHRIYQYPYIYNWNESLEENVGNIGKADMIIDESLKIAWLIGYGRGN